MGFADWVWESFVLEEALGAIIPTIPKLISTEQEHGGSSTRAQIHLVFS